MAATLADMGKFFVPFFKPYRTRLIALFLLPPLWCLAETAAPYLIKLIIDQISLNPLSRAQIQHVLVYTTVAYIALVFILELAIRLCNALWIKTFPRMRAALQSSILELTQTRSLQFIYDRLAGDLTSQYHNLTDSFEKLFRILLYGIYPTLLAFLFSLIFIALISGAFSIVFLLWFFAMNGVTWRFFKPSVTAAKNQTRIQSRLLGYIGNVIGNAIIWLAFPRALSAENAFQHLCRKNIALTERLEWVTFKADSWRSVLSWLLLAGMMIFLSVGWQKAWLSLGDFSFVTAICFYVRRSVWATSLQLAEFFKELGVMQDAMTLIFGVKKTHQATEQIDHRSLAGYAKCAIRLCHIQFGYSQARILFDDLNLSIPAGQKLGIAGASGAGKTSLLQLLLRLYEAQKGTILFNGQDYRRLPVEDLRALFSYVPQGAALLHRSVFDNIAFGKRDASEEDVHQAAYVCSCDEFIPRLEKGYQTIVGEGGYKLSGGQRQRIALARAYIRKAPIFILDEALSGLDCALEESVLERLCQHLAAHTLLLISHRTAALLKMDRVIMLKQGRIVLDTASKDLSKADGTLSALS